MAEQKTRTQADVQAMYSPWGMQESETLIPYYQRLASQRAGGILGTQGLLDIPAAGKALAEVAKNTPSCPVGTYWNGSACVPLEDSNAGQGDQGEGTEEQQRRMGLRGDDNINDVLMRQLQTQGPRAVDATVLFPGMLGGAIRAFEDWSDQQNLLNYNLQQGLDEQYGEGTAEAMSKNPLAMAHLMSTGDLRPVGEFGAFDIESYKPKGWKDLGQSVVADIMGMGNQISDGLFGTNKVWESQEDQRLANVRAQQAKWAEVSAGQVAAREAAEAAAREAAARMVVDQQAMASGSSGTGYTYRPASSASRSSSALGSGSNVGSRGGNASRGFSSGGW